jgi:putative NIF3 family GTP cyclohydrolase 1 type 2
MRLADLVSRLDSFFHLDRYAAADFAEIEEISREAGVPLGRYATETFMSRHNGLMLRNSDEVQAVYTLVFPSEEALREAERRAGGRPALIFTHHPMDMETSGRGLIPVSEDSLARLREARVSLYSAHAPLDCHESVSTSRALARALGVPAQAAFAGHMGGHAGVMGPVEPIAFEAFAERVRSACEVGHADVKRHSGGVRRVAVVAGGAAFPPLMQEAIDAGCDTYVTGDFRVRHGGPWAEAHRPEFDAFVERAPLNLIGGSHFATEAFVLRDDMVEFFRDAGLSAEFVPQSDPWR